MADSVKGLRITVLGPTGCGKTCLINSYVNNYCPNVYVPTDDPTLYYRTIRAVHSNQDDRLINVLLEIEDTYGCERTDGKDHYVKQRNVKGLFVKDRLGKGGDQPSQGSSAAGPFEHADAPRENEYKPLTKGQMAYILMFDINDTKSFDYIKAVYDDIDAQVEKNQNMKQDYAQKPIVWLVANKTDVDPHSREDHQGPIYQNLRKIKDLHRQLQKKADDADKSNPSQPGHYSRLLFEKKDQYGDGHSDTFRFMEISVYEFTKVRRLFRNIVDDLLEHKRTLWETQADKELDNGGENAGPSLLGGLSLFGGGQSGGGQGGGLFGGLFG